MAFAYTHALASVRTKRELILTRAAKGRRSRWVGYLPRPSVLLKISRIGIFELALRLGARASTATRSRNVLRFPPAIWGAAVIDGAQPCVGADGDPLADVRFAPKAASIADIGGLLKYANWRLSASHSLLFLRVLVSCKAST